MGLVKGFILFIFVGFCTILQVNPSMGQRFDYTRGRSHMERSANGEIKVNVQQREEVEPRADVDSPEKTAPEGNSRCPGVNCMPAPTMEGGKPCRPSFGDSEQCCPTWTCSSHSVEDEEDIDWANMKVVDEDGNERSKAWRYQRKNGDEEYRKSEHMGYHREGEDYQEGFQQGAFTGDKGFGPYPHRYHANGRVRRDAEPF